MSNLAYSNQNKEFGRIFRLAELPQNRPLVEDIADNLGDCIGLDITNPDGRIHRFGVEGNNKNGWYWCTVLDDGTQYAEYNSWTRVGGDNFSWTSTGEELTAEQQKEYKAKLDAKMKELEEESDIIVQGLQNTMGAANIAPNNHWYLQAKNVENYCGLLKLDARGNLIIPAYRGVNAQELHTTQIVYRSYNGNKDGKLSTTKLFLKGVRSAGCYFKFDGTTRKETIYLCEGYATGYSIWRATGATVISCFSAGNIVKVATIFRHATAVVADNDESETGLRGAKATGLPVILIPEVGMDANDYESKYGTDALRKLVLGESQEDEKYHHIDIDDSFYVQDEPEQFIIDDVLLDKSIGLIFGASQSGKTFIVVDMALTLATNQDKWFGKDVGKDKKILYVCAEGLVSVKHRILVWMKEHGMYGQKLPNLKIYPKALKLDDMDELQSYMRNLESEQKFKPDLIIIDTGRKCMSGEENSSDDVSKFLGACDEFKNHFDSSIVIVHHVSKGLSAEVTPRGSGVWIDHMDFANYVQRSKDGGVEISAYKRKDGLSIHDDGHFYRKFKLKPVTLDWTRANGEQIKSAVITADSGSEEEKIFLNDYDRMMHLICEHGKDGKLKPKDSNRKQFEWLQKVQTIITGATNDGLAMDDDGFLYVMREDAIRYLDLENASDDAKKNPFRKGRGFLKCLPEYGWGEVTKDKDLCLAIDVSKVTPVENVPCEFGWTIPHEQTKFFKEHPSVIAPSPIEDDVEPKEEPKEDNAMLPMDDPLPKEKPPIEDDPQAKPRKSKRTTKKTSTASKKDYSIMQCRVC